jgi:hypothetical protein
MSNRIDRLALALLLSAVAVPSAARAQEPATSLAELAQWVRIGDRVTVTDASGRKVKGLIGSLKPDGFSLVAEVVGGRDAVREFTQSDLQAITRREPDSLRNGALIGLGAGAVFFLTAFAASDGCEFESNCGALVAIGTAIYAGIGAGIGVGVDALVPGRERVIYRRPGGRATLGLSPRLTPQKQAVVFSVSF